MNPIERLLATWAPHTCLSCGRDGFVLCPPCRRDVRPATNTCYRCQRGHSPRTCADCRPQTALTSAAAVAAYEGSAKELVHRFKFKYARSAAGEMAAMMAQAYAAVLAIPGLLLVPVPTATRRVRQRGYDQAAVLARALSRQCPARSEVVLARLGQSQQHGASRHDRLSDRGRSYRLTRPHAVRGASVLLIDDVLTTGATFESAAAVLQAGGARRISGLAFARAELGRDT